MRNNPIGVASVLAVVVLFVLAGTANGTVASFSDSEIINATVSAGDSTAADTANTDGNLHVSLQNGRSADYWEDGIRYGPTTLGTSVLVITSPDDDLRLEIDSDSTRPLRFYIDAYLITNALGASGLHGVSATIDGQPLDFETKGVGSDERVVFTVDHFSTRYVVFTENTPPKAPPGQSGKQPGPPQTDTPTRKPQTAGPQSTATPTPTPTATPTPQSTPTPQPTPTATPQPTPTPTPQPTPTATPQPTPQSAPQQTATPTPGSGGGQQ